MPPKFTPRAPQVGRYWPGKPLKDEEESSSDDDEEEEEEEEEQQQQQQQDGQQVEESPKNDRKRATSAKLVTTMKTTSLSEQGPYVEPEEDSSESESESESEEPLQPEKRTSRVRQAHRRAIGDFVAVDQVDLEEEDEEDGESSEESSEEDSSEAEVVLPKRPLMRPTFVPRNQRDQPQRNGNNVGLANYGASDETSRNGESRRKEEAIQFVENEMRNAAQAALEAELNLESNRGIEAVDDTDDLDPAAEKAAWKLRELQRIKRERESLIAREQEREELEQRRNMDESERLKEDYARKREIEEEREQNRGKMEFMQKYYHKGAFYQDEEVLKRNYTVPTAEEHRNKEDLPKSLQVRSGELGRASRTKYTHLTAEDTSKKDSPWFDAQNSVNKRTLGKMGGMHDPNDRERKRRRS